MECNNFIFEFHDQERIFQRIREKEKKERELLVQKQRREARKREREAREAAEEEEKRRLAKIEKITNESKKIEVIAKVETKDEILSDDNTEDIEIQVIRTVSTSSYNSIDSVSSKSEISFNRSEPMKTRLKLADGNVDNASVITEGVNNQTNITRSSGSNRIRSLESFDNNQYNSSKYFFFRFDEIIQVSILTLNCRYTTSVTVATLTNIGLRISTASNFIPLRNNDVVLDF